MELFISVPVLGCEAFIAHDGVTRRARLATRCRGHSGYCERWGMTRIKEQASDLASTLTELLASGRTSLTSIAAALNSRGIPAVRGGRWSAVQVDRLLRATGLSSLRIPERKAKG